MGWIIAGSILTILQIISWIGNGGIPIAGGAAGIGYTIGANIGIIVAILFFVIGFIRIRKKGK